VRGVRENLLQGVWRHRENVRQDMVWRRRGGNVHHAAACFRVARVHACVVSRAPPRRRPRRRRASLGLAAD